MFVFTCPLSDQMFVSCPQFPQQPIPWGASPFTQGGGRRCLLHHEARPPSHRGGGRHRPLHREALPTAPGGARGAARGARFQGGAVYSIYYWQSSKDYKEFLPPECQTMSRNSLVYYMDHFWLTVISLNTCWYNLISIKLLTMLCYAISGASNFRCAQSEV